MGKAANNEGLKIKATYYNNIAVGLFVAGAVIPYLSWFTTVAASQQNWLWPSSFTESDWKKVVSTAVAMIIAISASMYLHRHALSFLKQIED
jgi:arginine exporter protein ArgO